MYRINSMLPWLLSIVGVGVAIFYFTKKSNANTNTNANGNPYGNYNGPGMIGNYVTPNGQVYGGDEWAQRINAGGDVLDSITGLVSLFV